MKGFSIQAQHHCHAVNGMDNDGNSVAYFTLWICGHSEVLIFFIPFVWIETVKFVKLELELDVRNLHDSYHFEDFNTGVLWRISRNSPFSSVSTFNFEFLQHKTNT
jgi:hypothetical protein